MNRLIVAHNPNRIIRSKAASTPVNKVKESHDFIVSNGMINSGPSPKQWKEEVHANGSVVYMNPASRAASVSGINKALELYDFLMSNSY